MIIRDTTQLGAALQRARKRAGWTQAQLAERAGVRQQTVSAVEGGKALTQLQTVFDIMAALGLEFTLQNRDAPAVPGHAELGQASDLEDLF